MHRAADQKALRQVAIAAAQELQLCNRFDALRCNLDVETAGHCNRCTNNSLVAAVHFYVLN
jgi:hypothetical protein